MKHIMLDLETLGTTADAVVLSIGALCFTPTNPFQVEWGVHYVLNDLDRQVFTGRTISTGTFRWWLKQNESARMALAEPDSGFGAIDDENSLEEMEGGLDTVLIDLQHQIKERAGRELLGVWGNGSDFDNAIIQHAAREHVQGLVWPYWANRCFRTYTSLFDPARRLRPEANNHHALGDCLNQMNWMEAICERYPTARQFLEEM